MDNVPVTFTYYQPRELYEPDFPLGSGWVGLVMEDENDCYAYFKDANDLALEHLSSHNNDKEIERKLVIAKVTVLYLPFTKEQIDG